MSAFSMALSGLFVALFLTFQIVFPPDLALLLGGGAFMVLLAVLWWDQEREVGDLEDEHWDWNEWDLGLRGEEDHYFYNRYERDGC